MGSRVEAAARWTKAIPTVILGLQKPTKLTGAALREIVEQVRSCAQELRRLRDESSYRSERNRANIVLAIGRGLSQRAAARLLGHAPSHVNETVRRFREEGMYGLRELRQWAGRLPKRDEILVLLPKLVAGQPGDFGWNRSTWSVELVALEVERQLGVRVSRTHMGRLLRKTGCRRVRPKPVIARAPEDRDEQVAVLYEELDALPDNDVVLFSDEVDIHLNPKVGPDWAPAGVRKDVVTPGKNQKHYLAGAYFPPTDELIVVDGPSKCSALFIQLLEKLADRYRDRGTIHLIVDNYVIHKSKITNKALEKLGGKVVLHFLPPYSPDHNLIERVWWDLHAHVTRNHRQPDIGALMRRVLDYVEHYDMRGAGAASRMRLAA